MKTLFSYRKVSLIIGICVLMVSFLPAIVTGQLTYDIHVDQSDTLTSLENGLGPEMKILDQGNRYIVLDFWHFRILFYEKGVTLEDHMFLNSIGSYMNAQTSSPYHPEYYDRLGWYFTGTIFRDTLWVANTYYGEVLQFDLDGNYIRTLPGYFDLLDVNDSQLYGFYNKKIYQYDDVTDSFILLNDLPMTQSIVPDKYRANVKIGYDLLGIKNSDSLAVYSLTDIINSGNPTPLFSHIFDDIADFEILPDKVVWLTDWNGNYSYSDFNGSNIQSGQITHSTHGIFYNGSQFHAFGLNHISTRDADLSWVSGIEKSSEHIDPKFLGADMENIYLFDQFDGGVQFAPLDHVNGTYAWNEDNEIGHYATNIMFRTHDDYQFLLAEAAGTYPIIRFDFSTMSYQYIDLNMKIQGIEVVEDNLFAISGKTLKKLDLDGTVLETHTLNNLQGRNLYYINDSSELFFTANENNVFVGFQDTLYTFDHSGVFENAYYFQMRSWGELFTYNQYVMDNAGPVQYIDTNTGAVDYLFDQALPRNGRDGFVYDKYYWYSPVWYQHTYQPMYKLIPDPVWEVQESNVDTRLWGVSAVTDEDGWIVGSDGVVLRTSNGGREWIVVTGDIDTLQVTTVAGLSDQTAFVGAYTPVTLIGHILKTTDGGQSWTSVYEEAECYLSNITVFFGGNHGMAIGDPVGGTWRVLETTDGGDTWLQKAGAPAQVDDEYGYISSVYWVDESNGWFGTKYDRAYRTTNGGDSWDSIGIPLLTRVTTLAFNSSGEGIAGGGSTGDLARSSDNGDNWESIVAPEAGTIYRLIHHDRAFWLLLNNKVFRSENAGDSWEEVTSAADNLRALSFAKYNEWNYGWAVGNNGTIIRSINKSGFEWDETKTVIPREFVLHQNYPNPFNPETMVTYTLPVRSHTRLNIYSITGRMVRTLVDRVETSGQKLVMWDGRDDAGMHLPSGVYLCTLVTEKCRLSTKMVLIR